MDTGAARSQIVDDGTVPGLTAHSTGTSTGALGTRTATLATLGELSLGPVRASNLDVWLQPGPAGPSARHLLGMDLLIRACCRFSFSHNELGLDRSPAAAARLPLTLVPSGHSYLVATWRPAAGQPVAANALWDTGASITVVDEAFFNVHRDLFRDPASSIGTDATGTSSTTSTYTIAGPTIGGHRFAPHRVAIVDLSSANAQLTQPMDLIAGYPLLSQADWIFDYPARRWAITTPPKS
ncbi:MAG: hypothetical protein ACRDRN_26745 [Sciscionella sp.]